MSYVLGEERETASPYAHLTGWGWVFAGLLVVTKALDAGTTAVGLMLVPGFVEGNPLAATVLNSSSVGAGLLSLSLLVVFGVGLVTEIGARYLAGHPDAPDWSPTLTRMVGYGPLSVIFAAAAIHNAGLIIRVVLSG